MIRPYDCLVQQSRAERDTSVLIFAVLFSPLLKVIVLSEEKQDRSLISARIIAPVHSTTFPFFPERRTVAISNAMERTVTQGFVLIQISTDKGEGNERYP